MYSPEVANKDNTPNEVNWILYFDSKIISVIRWIHLQCKAYSEKLQVRTILMMITMMIRLPQETLEDSYHLPSIRLISLISSHNVVQFWTKEAKFQTHWKHTYFCKLSEHCLSFSLIHTAIPFFSKRHLCFTWYKTVEKVVKVGRQKGPSGSHHHQCTNMTLTKPGTHTKKRNIKYEEELKWSLIGGYTKSWNANINLR
jgi:hypothetical protein